MEVETKDEEVVEIPATSDSDEIIDSEIAEEPGTETDVSEEPSFAELGLPSFEGKSRKEVAQMITDLQSDVSKGNERYGTVANELGKLRKLAEKPAEKPEEKKVDLIEEMPEMTAGEVADFNELYDKNPVKAVLKYGGPALNSLSRRKSNSHSRTLLRSSLVICLALLRTSWPTALFSRTILMWTTRHSLL